MTEIWKDIPNYEGHYQVSTLGRVKSIKFKKHRIMKYSIDKDGYYRILLRKFPEVSKKFGVNRLVAITFLPNYHQKPICDHKNKNRKDNRIFNLRWLSHQENNMNRVKLQNSTSIYTGLSWCKVSKKWKVSLKYYGRNIHLGYFDDENEAKCAYEKKKKELYPNL